MPRWCRVQPQGSFMCMGRTGFSIRAAGRGAGGGHVRFSHADGPIAGGARADTRPTSDGNTTKATRRTARSPRRHARPSPPPSSRCEIRLTLSGRCFRGGPRGWVLGGGCWTRCPRHPGRTRFVLRGTLSRRMRRLPRSQVLRELYIAERDQRNILMVRFTMNTHPFHPFAAHWGGTHTHPDPLSP